LEQIICSETPFVKWGLKVSLPIPLFGVRQVPSEGFFGNIQKCADQSDSLFFEIHKLLQH